MISPFIYLCTWKIPGILPVSSVSPQILPQTSSRTQGNSRVARMEHQTPLVSLEISGNEKCGRPSPFLFGFRKTATGQGATRQGPGGRQDTDALGDPFLRVALIARPLALALRHLAPWPTACSRRHRCMSLDAFSHTYLPSKNGPI